jgi:hypothetical protein
MRSSPSNESGIATCEAGEGLVGEDNRQGGWFAKSVAIKKQSRRFESLGNLTVRATRTGSATLRP